MVKTLRYSLAAALALGAFAVGYQVARHAETSRDYSTQTDSLTDTKAVSPMSVAGSKYDSEELLPIEAAIAQLDRWRSLPNAMSDQYLLYDAIARAPIEQIAELEKRCYPATTDFESEILYPLYLRWAADDPLGLLRYYVANATARPVFQSLDQRRMYVGAANISIDETWVQFRILEKSGSATAADWSMLTDIARMHPESDASRQILDAVAARSKAQPPRTAPQPNPKPETPKELQPPTRAEFIDAIADFGNSDASHALVDLAKRYAKRDPSGAWELIQAIESNDVYMAAAHATLNELAKLNSESVMDIAISATEGPFVERNRRLAFFAAKAAIEADPKSTIEWYRSHGASVRATQLLVTAVGAVSSPSADTLSLVEALPESAAKSIAQQQLLNNLAGINWHDAHSWIQTHLHGEEALDARASIIATTFENDRIAALDVIDRLPDGTKKNDAVATVARAWARQDPDEAIRWALQLDESETQAVAIENLARDWYQRSPKEVIEFAKYSQNSELKSTLDRIINTDGRTPAINAYVPNFSDFDESDLRAADDSVIQGFVTSDPKKALAIVRSWKRDDGRRPEVARVLMTTWAETDPESAAKALLTVDDETANETLGNVVMAYLESSPDKLSSLLSSAVPESLREKICYVIANQSSIRNYAPEVAAEARKRLTTDVELPLIPILE